MCISTGLGKRLLSLCNECAALEAISAVQPSRTFSDDVPCTFAPPLTASCLPGFAWLVLSLETGAEHPTMSEFRVRL